MKKTYITTMPNHIGAFLRASECFAELGVNITRVSYNKAVDSHTLFIDAEGTEAQLKAADERLERIGYLKSEAQDRSIALLEFRLKDVPGSVTAVLRLIQEIPVKFTVLTPFSLLGKFLSHEQQLLARMSEHERITGLQVREFIVIQSGHLVDHGALQMHDLIM